MVTSAPGAQGLDVVERPAKPVLLDLKVVAACRFIQNRAEVPKQRASRSAGSALIRHCRLIRTLYCPTRSPARLPYAVTCQFLKPVARRHT